MYYYSKVDSPPVKMDRTLVIGSAASFFLLTFIILYLRFFPILVNEQISDAIFLTALGHLVVILSLMILWVRSPKESGLVLLPLGLFSFVARAVPNLRLSYPPLNDPYYHSASARMLIEAGSTDVTRAWYDLAPFQLHWPDMHILTAGLNQVAGVDPWSLIRYQEPFLGIVFFLAVYLLAKTISSREDVALLAAALACFSDVIIFYQSEYHPQGYALVLFVLLIVMFLRSRERGNFPYAVLLLITTSALTLSHHFSSLFVAAIALAAAGLSMMLPKLKMLKFDARAMTSDINTYLLIGITALSYHLFVYNEPMRQFIRMMGLEMSMALSIMQMSVASGFTSQPLSLTFFNSVKWMLLFLSLTFVVLYLITKRRSPTTDRVILPLFLILATGVGATTISGAPLDRILAFALPLLTPFAALFLIRLRDTQPPRRVRHWKFSSSILALAVPVLVIMAGFLNAPNTPSMFVHDSDPNANYWYSNVLPEMDQYKNAGTWTQDRLEDRPLVYTNFDTRTTVFYFGEKYNGNMLPATDKVLSPSYILVNPSIPYAFEGDRYEAYGHNFNVIYHNGELRMYEVWARA